MGSTILKLEFGFIPISLLEFVDAAAAFREGSNISSLGFQNANWPCHGNFIETLCSGFGAQLMSADLGFF